MDRRLFQLLLILLLIVASCQQPEHQKIILDERFWDTHKDLDVRNWLPITKRNGEFISYCENGNIEIIGTFKNGVPQDSLVRYWPNGNKRDYVEFSNGLVDGLQLSFFEDGTLKYYVYYSEGLHQYFKERSKKGELIDFVFSVAMKSKVVSQTNFSSQDTIHYNIGLTHCEFENRLYRYMFFDGTDTLETRFSDNISEKFQVSNLSPGIHELSFIIEEYNLDDKTFQGAAKQVNTVEIAK